MPFNLDLWDRQDLHICYTHDQFYPCITQALQLTTVPLSAMQSPLNYIDTRKSLVVRTKDSCIELI